MCFASFDERIINLKSETEMKQLQTFLKQQNLLLDKNIDYSVALMDGEKIAATGSLGGRVLKCIAVDEAYKNTGLSAKIVTLLVNEAFSRGQTHLFIFTKPENKVIFSEMGFYCIEEVQNMVILMENRSDGIKKYLEEISQGNNEKKANAAVVVNCNPFTLGHRYLIEYAAAQCNTLHVFVLWEDKSSFPSEVRYRLVKEGAQHLHNVIVHKGKDYIISDATFPSYFIKEYQELVETHARLDLAIFGKYIAPTLGINKRFVGEEPYCKVTAAYNAIMQEVLPAYGIDVRIIPRKLNEGQPISASRVRELLRTGKLNEAKALVPETTYQFLLSDEAADIIKHIQAGSQRH